MAYIPVYNLDDNKFLKNRLLYHTASRVGIQTGQSLLQATNGDGHIVTYGQVWTAPQTAYITHTTEAMKTTTDGILATNDLVAKFMLGAVVKQTLGNGTVYTNAAYPAVLLYYQVLMSGIAGSNAEGSKYEAYGIFDGTNRAQNFIPPTAVKDNGLPVPGYTGRVEVYKGDKWTDILNCADVQGAWASSQGNWLFVYMSGLLLFHPEHTLVGNSYTAVRYTGFHYIGDTLDVSLKAINDALDALGDIDGGNLAEALASKLDVSVYNAKVAELLGADADLLAKFAGYYTSAQVDSKIALQVKSAVKYIGKVDTYELLPTDLTAANHGNIYHVVVRDGITVNSEYIWTQLESDSEGRWLELGSLTDLSNYYTTSLVDAAIKVEADRAKEAELANAGAITALTTRATTALGEIAADLAQLILDRLASDSLLRQSITAEALRAAAALKVNADNITGLIARAKEAELANAAAITALTTRATGVLQGLAEDISDAQQRLTTALGEIDVLQGATAGYTALNNIASAIATAKSEAIAAAESDATEKANAAQTAAVTQAEALAAAAIETAASDATSKAETAVTTANSYTDTEIKKVTDSLSSLQGVVYFELIVD